MRPDEVWTNFGRRRPCELQRTRTVSDFASGDTTASILANAGG